MISREVYEYDFASPGYFRSVSAKPRHLQDIANEFYFFSKDIPIVDLFGCGINSIFVDWLDIAIATYMVDRVSPRDPRKFHSELWVRDINFKIAVRHPEFWNQHKIKSRLSELLNLLTDDDWHLEFVTLSHRDRFYESQRHLRLSPISNPRVALYSGGLDSFAGALKSLNDDGESAFVFVSCVTNSRQLHNQRQQMAWLQDVSNVREIIHQPIELGFRWAGSTEVEQESTQRTRGFLFSTIGSIAAINAGTTKLEIYENGIGAINLAYDSTQVGAMSSKSVNPLTLIRIEGLVKSIIGSHFEIENRFVLSTKGEMCSDVANYKLNAVIPFTFSCDGFPVHESGKPQCGVCTSCLLRRLSLEAAGLGVFDDGNGYGTDLVSANSTPSFNQLNDLRAMEFQYFRLARCLEAESPWVALVSEFPQLQSVVSEMAISRRFDIKVLESSFLRLYEKYCLEWSNFSARQHLHKEMRLAA